VILALHQALLELEQEGGVEGRAARYQANYKTLMAGMRALGFVEYLPPEDQSYIITTFRHPEHPKFNFEEFYRRLNDKGYVIYPGRVGEAQCFRIGTIGRIFPSDMEDLLGAIGRVLAEMGIGAPLKAARQLRTLSEVAGAGGSLVPATLVVIEMVPNCRRSAATKGVPVLNTIR
jgi:2-aminoethylphosphonate-pyruvate transaminase